MVICILTWYGVTECVIHLEVTLFGWQDVKIEELTNQNVGKCSVGFMDRFSWMFRSISQTILLLLLGGGGGGVLYILH